MKTQKLCFLLVFGLMLLLGSPLFAEEGSERDMCRTEANDAGLDTQEEISAYIAECLAQLKQEKEEAAELDGPDVSLTQN